ncbi:hypothetical protein [Legionella cardiaca]|uniref:Tfp pilus assembly protein PilV n=1 Tax=Legionella cardiaca TaxID=1071983 RepID=A0ABY8ANK8_9GAMM|nr:hypothetical protein [Legionella cardiaca]WED42044.1 hypothetical protein PXX05_08870 [Legionella cardiaca]
MKTSHGFSVMELLVTLLLVTSISLTVLQQQLQIKQLLHRALQRSLAATLLDNNSERALGRQPLLLTHDPFQFKQTPIAKGSFLEISWGFELPDSSCCKLQREIMVHE